MSSTTTDPNQPTPDDDKTPPPAEEQKPAGEAPEPQEPEREAKALLKRISRLTARNSMIQRERDELAFKLQQNQYQQNQYPQQAPQQPIDPQLQQAIEAEAERRVQARVMDEKMRAFHKQGAEAFTDWSERCTNLQAMGADPQMAQLLVEMPDGYKVAAALHDEPDELERIAGIRSERGRAVALGQYAARLEARPAALPVSKAPRPIAPVEARATPRFNPYTSDSMEALLKHFSTPGARPP